MFEADDLIGPAFQLVCQKHPDFVTAVSQPADFDTRVSDGGCSNSCACSRAGTPAPGAPPAGWAAAPAAADRAVNHMRLNATHRLMLAADRPACRCPLAAGCATATTRTTA